MYLDPWMIVMLIAGYGLCAIVNRRVGLHEGGTMVLQKLEEQRYIKITETGQIKRWTPYDDEPVKRKRTKKVK